MFKNALIYRIEAWDKPDLAVIEARLDGARFIACGATQPESAGWVAPRGARHGALAESVGGQLILNLCTETKAVPASVVKSQLDERLDKIEQDTGRRPRGKSAREIKEEIVHDLMPRAFPKRSTTLVWVDAAARLLVVGAASARKADGVVTLLVDLLGGGLRLNLIQTELAPATAMADWLTQREAPSPFSVDRDCELKQADSEKSAIRYARHSLDIDEVGEHIAQGKLPTQLALTWNSRVSFVLTETLALKKIKLLDVVIEGQSAASGKGDDGFDADVAITTGELSPLMADLIDALGGEIARQAAVTAPGVVSGAAIRSDETAEIGADDRSAADRALLGLPG
jgi:recombination associated protein RdgC